MNLQKKSVRVTSFTPEMRLFLSRKLKRYSPEKHECEENIMHLSIVKFIFIFAVNQSSFFIKDLELKSFPH